MDRKAYSKRCCVSFGPTLVGLVQWLPMIFSRPGKQAVNTLMQSPAVSRMEDLVVLILSSSLWLMSTKY
eukprot:8733131-Ditylum_brightwellii.AAC.1